MLDTLKLLPHDPMLAIMVHFNADTNVDKVDLGLGVYRNNQGQTPVMAVVKKAEQQLVNNQDSKSYLGMLGVDAQ